MHGKTLFSHAPVQQHNHNLQRWVKTSQNLRWFFLPCPAGGKWPVETKGWRMVVLMEKEEQSENTKPLNGMAADQWLWRTPRHPPWGHSGLTQGNKALRSQKRRTRQVGRAQGPPPRVPGFISPTSCSGSTTKIHNFPLSSQKEPLGEEAGYFSHGVCSHAEHPRLTAPRGCWAPTSLAGVVTTVPPCHHQPGSGITLLPCVALVRPSPGPCFAASCAQMFLPRCHRGTAEGVKQHGDVCQAWR